MEFDVECEARVLRQRGGFSEDDVPGGVALAESLGYEIRTRLDPRLLRGRDSLVFWPHGKTNPPAIALRSGLSEERLHWWCAHEVFEARLHELDYRGENIERVADAGAAALLMPRLAFREAASEHREDIVSLAADFLCSQTAATLRLAETRCADASVVVAPTRLYVSVLDGFVLPPEPALRRAAREGMPGMRKTVLTDARKRVALVA